MFILYSYRHASKLLPIELNQDVNPPKVGATIVDSVITLNSNILPNTNRLDILAGNYYNKGYSNFSINILGNSLLVVCNFILYFFSIKFIYNLNILNFIFISKLKTLSFTGLNTFFLKISFTVTSKNFYLKYFIKY